MKKESNEGAPPSSVTLLRPTKEGVFAGYASYFGRKDLSGDVVMRGAFACSLERHRRGHAVKMLYQHAPEALLGRWIALREDAVGLFVEGRILTQLPRGREVLLLMQAGILDGLSIGFQAIRARKEAKTGRRLLFEVALWEISLVTFPLLPEARAQLIQTRGGALPSSVGAPPPAAPCYNKSRGFFCPKFS